MAFHPNRAWLHSLAFFQVDIFEIGENNGIQSPNKILPTLPFSFTMLAHV
jgi:hypothetical protein